MSPHGKNIDNSDIVAQGLFNLWRSLTISVLLYLIPILAAIYLDVFYYPFVAFITVWCAYMYLRIRKRDTHSPYDCRLPITLTARMILVYGVVMLVINAFVLRMPNLRMGFPGVEKPFQFYYFPVLLLSVVSVVVYFFSSGRACAHCSNCAHISEESDVYSRFLHEEISHNMPLQFFIMNIALALAGWGYFLLLYNSADISKLDRMILHGIPVIVIMCHEIVTSVRYLMITLYRGQLYSDSLYRKDTTTIRVLIVCGDKLLLRRNGDGVLDTPVSVDIAFIRCVDDENVKSAVGSILPLSDAIIRYAYKSVDAAYNSNIFHYFCFLDRIPDSVVPDAEWLSSLALEKENKANHFSIPLSCELRKITRTLVAHKMFEADGTHRFNIKKYVPSVMISDFKDTMVDYDDSRWLKYLK